MNVIQDGTGAQAGKMKVEFECKILILSNNFSVSQDVIAR